MTHSEKRAEWWKEGIIGLGVGVLYGTTSVLVGHPFDTVKTKMQAQVGFEKTNMFQSFTKTVREQGIKGLYRGCLPPIFGSGIYRSAQFAAFEGMYTFLGDNYSSTRYEIPHTGGLQVSLSGHCSCQSLLLMLFQCIRCVRQCVWLYSLVYAP